MSIKLSGTFFVGCLLNLRLEDKTMSGELCGAMIFKKY
jgi:hypothetical protein